MVSSPLEFNGKAARYIENVCPDVKALIVCDGNYGFEVIGKFPLDMLRQIAESMK